MAHCEVSGEGVEGGLRKVAFFVRTLAAHGPYGVKGEKR